MKIYVIARKKGSRRFFEMKQESKDEVQRIEDRVFQNKRIEEWCLVEVLHRQGRMLIKGRQGSTYEGSVMDSKHHSRGSKLYRDSQFLLQSHKVVL